MDPFREISLIVGGLYILGLVAGITSIARAVDDGDYLTKSARNSGQIYMAAFSQLLMAVFYTGIALVFYPILKVYNESLALGFLSFRIIAVVFVLIGTLILLLLLKVSQKFAKAGSANLSDFSLAGNLLKTARDLVNHVIMVIMLCIGGIMLYIIMIQSGLIPVWLSVWGIVGSAIAIMASILVMMKYIEVLTPAYIIFNLPIAVQEIVFAVWLIVKGFNQV